MRALGEKSSQEFSDQISKNCKTYNFWKPKIPNWLFLPINPKKKKNDYIVQRQKKELVKGYSDLCHRSSAQCCFVELSKYSQRAVVRTQYAQATGNERSFNRDASTDRDGHAHAYTTAYISKRRDYRRKCYKENINKYRNTSKLYLHRIIKKYASIFQKTL